MAENGLAIRIPNGGQTVSAILRNKYIPLHGRPKKLKIPGGSVALVQENGRVSLLGRAVRLEGPMKVRLVTGKTKPAGYRLLLSSVKKLSGSQTLSIRWRVIGQFRYFDAKKWVPKIVGPQVDRQVGDYLDERVTGAPRNSVSRHKFTGSIPGLPRNDPEAVLVRAYVNWLRAHDEFEQHTLWPGRLRIDLFDKSRWRLIEAKLARNRETLRGAVGQLMDYKRFYPRGPALGILVGSRPKSKSRAYLAHYRITAIWRTRGGRFADSSDGAWTKLRRRESRRS